MLITAEEVKEMERFKSYSIEDITRKLKKIEYAIRSYTHNYFVSKIRFKAEIKNNIILFNTDYIKANDTVIISNYFIDDYIYNVKEITDEGIVLDEEIEDSQQNSIIKVFYPFDVIEGALDVLEWDFKMRNKVGIKSETISRHSVTYYDNDSNNTVNGYPTSLFSFLKPYRKPQE